MKAEQLMIGDWVEYADCPLQINSINQFNGVELLDMEEGDFHNLTPIPLTPELLKKNGWEMFNYDGWVHYYRIFGNSALPFVLHSMIEGEVVSQEINEFSTSTDTSCGICVKYVHELQHALRLCGLNDKADNFKVE